MSRIFTGTSLQERFFPDLRCFGCGPANDKGLRLQSFADGEAVRAQFQPWPEHDNGLGHLNGGIIATVLDCHSAAAMMVAAQRRGLVLDGSLPYVTAGIDVAYRRPAPLADPVTLVARAIAAGDDVIEVEAELWWRDLVRASARSIWKRWRPRNPDSASHVPR